MKDRSFEALIVMVAFGVVYLLALYSCGVDCERRGGQPVYDGAGLITCVERK